MQRGGSVILEAYPELVNRVARLEIKVTKLEKRRFRKGPVKYSSGIDEVRVLKALENKRVYPSALARLLHVERSSLYGALNVLKVGGFVACEGLTRKNCYFLTDKGRELLVTIREFEKETVGCKLLHEVDS